MQLTAMTLVYPLLKKITKPIDLHATHIVETVTKIVAPTNEAYST